MDAREYERSFALEGTHWWFRAKRALVLSVLHRFGWRGGRGLDVGCGTGGMLEALAKDEVGGTWVGADVATAALTFSRKRGLVRLAGASALALPFRSEAFDVCLCLDVLYHRGVTSDMAALAECHRILKRGGLLVLTDSAYAWLRSGHDEAVHGSRRYTRGELTTRIRAVGFTPLFASYAYCLLFPAVAAFRLARQLVGGRQGSDLFQVPRPVGQLLSTVQAFERALLRLAPLPFGSSVLCVARK